jgi:hypothetical protein
MTTETLRLVRDYAQDNQESNSPQTNKNVGLDIKA